MKEIIRQFSNVPDPRPETQQWVNATTAVRDLQETVHVGFAPSGMFDQFADAFLKSVDAYFTGPFSSGKPRLKGELFGKKDIKVENIYTDGEILQMMLADTIDKEEAAKMRVEKHEVQTTSYVSDSEILRKYFETIFWANIAENHREYAKQPEHKNLLNHIRKQRVNCPILIINAINCVGPVVVTEKAVRLEPKLLADYDYKSELLTLDQFKAVSDWFEILISHGFECVNYVKLGAEGNRDFMMMTLESQEKPKKGEAFHKDYWKAPFNIRSSKIAANIIGLYRYFFYTAYVKYFSDDRRIFHYGTYDDNSAIMKDIVRTMLRIEKMEKFAAVSTNNEQVQKIVDDAEQRKESDAE